MKISILIPCYNEELTIEKCIFSCLNQTRRADEIVVVDDSSTDNTPEILKKFEKFVKIVRTQKNTGNKSYAQEYGLNFITGDIFITTDGDTVLKSDFVETVEKDMQDPSVAAVAGYVRSLKCNWITACRALDYAIGQNIDKLAQDYINFVFVIPGAAGVFRTDVFKEKVNFDHDTLTEDLDFTYRLHKMDKKILYNRNAICYTQDPSTLKSYINQMRRWFAGGWQNLIKHFISSDKPEMALEISLIYVEGLFFSILLFVLPIINLWFSLELFLMYSVVLIGLGIFGSFKEKRADILIFLPAYVFLRYINAWIFLEQFLKEVILKQKNLVWFKPKRVEIKL